MTAIAMMKPDLIDVSSAQPPAAIDWPRVGAAGIVAGYVRGGGGTKPDPAASKHLAGLASITRPRGLYWDWHPDADPVAQARLCAKLHRDYGCELAPMADCELVNGVNDHELAARLDTFCRTVDSELVRQQIGVYTGPGYWSAHFKGDAALQFQTRALWIAHYNPPSGLPDVPWPWDEHSIWQFLANTIWSDDSFGPHPKTAGAHVISPAGHIDGFDGEIDVDVLGNTTLAELWAGLPPHSALDMRNVRDRQRALRRLGYDCGKLDGLWGDRSKAALALAQRDLKVPVTRIFDSTTEWAIADKLGL